MKYRSTKRLREERWDNTQNKNGTENQRSDVIAIDLECSIAAIDRAIVSLADLFIIMNTKRGIKIVRVIVKTIK